MKELHEFAKDIIAVAKCIEGKKIFKPGIGGGIPVSKTVAIALLTLKNILPQSAIIVCSEYGECMCEDREEGHICWDEVTVDDIDTLLWDSMYENFEIWLSWHQHSASR